MMAMNEQKVCLSTHMLKAYHLDSLDWMLDRDCGAPAEGKRLLKGDTRKVYFIHRDQLDCSDMIHLPDRFDLEIRKDNVEMTGHQGNLDRICRYGVTLALTSRCGCTQR